LSGCIFATNACIYNQKNPLNSNISSRCLHNMVNFTSLWLRSVGEFGALRYISTSFASWLRYCSDVAHWRPTKPCTTFGRLLGCCIIHLRVLLPPDGILPGAKFTCVLYYWQRYYTALEQRASAKICGMLQLQGIKLRNVCRERHLYSAGRPSRWASAHILVHLSNKTQNTKLDLHGSVKQQ